MNSEELRAAVPIHPYKGHPYFVRIDEVPEPWRSQFWQALRGAQCPVIPGEGKTAYCHDWLQWVGGSWYGDEGPSGLDDA